MKRNVKQGVLIVVIVFFAAVIVESCSYDYEKEPYYSTDELNISDVLEKNPEDFSIFVEMLHVTGFYTSLNSYGSYTCFVPVNEVLRPYLQTRWGVSSVADMKSPDQIADLQHLIQFHTMAKSRSTSAFVEGRMSDTTYTGEFLTTSYIKGGGVKNLIINREAKLLEYDIKAANGYIHSIDNVLTPYEDPIPAAIEKNGKYSIFAEALKRTGLYETLSELKTETGGKKNFTVFAETDSVFALSGIDSFDDLAEKYADSDDYQDVENGLNRFMAYHAASVFLYSAEMPTDGFLSTELANYAIKIFKTEKLLKINESETGTKSTWISLLMDQSNMPAKNGVYHSVDTVLDVFVPKAKYIIFDVVSDQPEIQAKMVASHAYVPSSTYEFVNWYPDLDLRYMRSSANPTNDYTTFSLTGCIWYEFETPIIPKGKYEFLICGNAGNSARGKYQLYWDGQPIGALYDATLSANAIGFPDSVAMEAKGWRHGKKNLVNKDGETAYDIRTWCRYIVTKELLCPEQKTHTVRLLSVKDGGIGMDYFEWIPVE